MPTPNFGWRLPVPTDIPDVVTDLSNLGTDADATAKEAADAITVLEGRMEDRAWRMGYQITSPNASGQATVTWGAGIFASPPIFLVQLGDAASTCKTVAPAYSTITASSCSVAHYNASGGNVTTGNFRIVYLVAGTPA